jgi:hypothetical protein
MLAKASTISLTLVVDGAPRGPGGRAFLDRFSLGLPPRGRT